jgi:hypothetical protein
VADAYFYLINVRCLSLNFSCVILFSNTVLYIYKTVDFSGYAS